jgi:hypothetical protein
MRGKKSSFWKEYENIQLSMARACMRNTSPKRAVVSRPAGAIVVSSPSVTQPVSRKVFVVVPPPAGFSTRSLGCRN